MELSITCSTATLKEVAKRIRVALPRRRDQRMQHCVELSLQPDLMIVRVFGVSCNVDCHPGVYCKIIMPAGMFLQTIRTWPASTITLQFLPGQMKCGGLTLASPEILMVHPENQRTIDLSMNYKTNELLNLRYTYAFDELSRMKILKELEAAEQVLENDIDRAHFFLKKYGVSFKELDSLILEKVRRTHS